MRRDVQVNDAVDLVIRGATIVDGTGTTARAGDVAVRGGRIVAVGAVGAVAAPSAEMVDGTGLVLAPGFIDVHAHDDAAVLDTPDMTAKVSQGVATVVAGNCGISLAPMRPAELPSRRRWVNASGGVLAVERASLRRETARGSTIPRCASDGD